MKMKIKLLMLALLFGSSINAYAIDGYALTFGKGGKPNGVEIYRISLLWDWNKEWFKTGDWSIGGHWDLNVAHIRSDAHPDGDNDNLTLAAITPVFRIQRLSREPYSINPYLEGAIGFALLTKTRIADKSLSTAYQFDDRIGVGVRFGKTSQWDLAFHYQHYSNASIKQPNQGIDLKYVGKLSYWFD